MGRNRKIDLNDKQAWRKIDRLLESQCTGTEIAAAFGLHPNTFYDNIQEKYNVSFTEYSQQKKQVGKSLVRREIFKSVLQGKSTPERIFWAKNHLEMSDNPMPSNDQSKALADAVEKLEIIE